MTNPVDEKKIDETLGEYIRRARLSRGMTVEELSAVTKIAVPLVKAIEESNWKFFPVAAYVRGYLNSVCLKLNLDQKLVLSMYAAETGAKTEIFEAVEPTQFMETVSTVTIEAVSKKKKNKTVPIVVGCIIVFFLIVSHFLGKASEEETAQAGESMDYAEESVEQQDEGIPDGAEAVVEEKSKPAAKKADPSTESVSQAVVDEAVRKSDLPASATIFISSTSKTDEKAAAPAKPAAAAPAKVEPAKPVAAPAPAPASKPVAGGPTSFVIIGSGVAESWVGVKHHQSDTTYYRQTTMNEADKKFTCESNDSLYIVIGEPKAIKQMLINGVETQIPVMKRYGSTTRFRLFNGKLIEIE